MTNDQTRMTHECPMPKPQLVIGHSRPLRGRGFTLVEMCIALVVMSMVLGALAAFSLAMAKSWDNGATTDTTGGQTVATIPIIANIAAARLDNEITNAIAVGAYYAGTLSSSTGQQSAILLWS